MNKLSNQISSTNKLVSKLEKRITDLENILNKNNKLFHKEQINKDENNNSQQNLDASYFFQIKSLKEKVDNLSRSTNENLEQLRTDITKDFTDRTSLLQNIIEEKSMKIDSYNNCALNNQYMHKSVENNLNSKISFVESEIFSSIKKLSEDLNSNSAKIDFIEKRQNDNFNLIKEQITNINNKIINFQNEFNILNQFKNNANQNFEGMASDIIQQQDIINNFTSKILNKMNNFELNFEKNNQIIDEELKRLVQWKDDIYKNIEIINEKTIAEIKNFCEDLSKDLQKNQNEMTLLENHLIDEQKNFGKFVQEKMSSYEININKSIEYTSEDLKFVQKDVDNLKKNFEDFKDKTFEAVNDIEKYQNKKYDDLFRIMTVNNLVMPNFNYNNKIIKGNNAIETVNNNIIINEQNYNIGLSKDN